MESKRAVLKTEDAVAMLPDGDTVHTFRQGGMMLVGADWPREKILEAFGLYPVERSGPTATAMCHGLAFTDDLGTVFVETRKEGGASF